MASKDTKRKDIPEDTTSSLPSHSSTNTLSTNIKRDTKGITASKGDDLSEWYTQILQKAELIEYGPVSGCYILRPNAYQIWERVQAFFDQLIKEDGVKNAYFPLFIPESLFSKESAHVKGFAPEVAWVETGGHTSLSERLAIRPTSETIIYDAYAKWIRSYKDLPLRLNQWCNVVRWEFKHPVPFLRSREFLWQEGHTAFATKKEAVEEAHRILGFYEKVFRELYAIPVLSGRKSEAEKFAGAEFTLSVEAVLPSGKAVQGATSHHLGQNFSKAFGIEFMDDHQQKQHAWQNSWGISTRSIGIMVLMHSDDKGLILPPGVAGTQVVIVPIFSDESQSKVRKEAQDLERRLKKENISVLLDLREGCTPGWKFNEWEVKGLPLRLEIGPKDIEKKQVMAVRRDTREKQALPMAGVEKEVKILLEQIQRDLYEKAQRSLESSLVHVLELKEAQKQLDQKKIVFAPWCATEKCEEELKARTGAKSLNSPLKQPSLKKGQKCFACGNNAESWFYFGKSY